MKLFSYPPPQNNANCLCLQNGNLMTAMFCTTGHMAECHSGLSCDEAACSHLPRYADEAFDYSVEDAPRFLVKVLLGEIQVAELVVYAPNEPAAEIIMRRWLLQTENLQNAALKIEPVGDVIEHEKAVG